MMQCLAKLARTQHRHQSMRSLPFNIMDLVESAQEPTCDPLVLGPEFAIDRTPRPVWVSLESSSSLKVGPYMDSPPVPVAVGSPPCSQKQCEGASEEPHKVTERYDKAELLLQAQKHLDNQESPSHPVLLIAEWASIGSLDMHFDTICGSTI